MDTVAMNTFLSEGSIRQHTEHLRRLRLRHSVNEECYPEIKGKGLRAVSRMNIPVSERREIVENMRSIKAHELYFSSFSDTREAVKPLRRYYSSEDAFLYEALELSRDCHAAFLYVCVERGRPTLCVSRGEDDIFIAREPLLALDLFEHAYFSDYGFEREKYLKAALCRLDLKRLAEHI